jgi:methyl-accepting chemotaxis protein
MKKIGEGMKQKLSNSITSVKSVQNKKKEAKPHSIENNPRNNETKNSILIRLIKSSSTIRVKLIASFMVPIAFIIILGVVSFGVASKAIVKNFEKSSLQTINMTGEYLRFGLSSVEATSIQYANDDTLSKYLLNLYANDKMAYNSNYNNFTNMLFAKSLSDEFIENIFILSDVVKSISTATKSSTTDGVYAGFAKTDLGKEISNNRTKTAWLGKDEYLDTALKTTPDTYSMRFIRNVSNASGIVIIDVGQDTVEKTLAGIGFDKSGYLAFVTPDGKEIIAKDKKKKSDNEKAVETIFSDKEFYTKAVKSEKTSGAEYVKYKNGNYLFMYSKIGKTGATICALMPKNVISHQADNIKKVSYIIVTIAIIVAVLTAIAISMGIDKVIKEIILRLKEAAKGDLTVIFNSKRKDEFRILIEEIQLTFENMKDLILHVNGLSSEVSSSSENVTKTSEMFLKSSKDISAAMSEIEQGISQQAKDAEECLTQMDNLSQKIALVSDNTKEISSIADRTKQSIQEGTIVTEDLNSQTQSTIEITTEIINNIERLDEKSLSIRKIVNVINDIANQTNLLSLNASIEAARAGEYGRGFAVVASEIRNLAEQSQGSVNDIKKIIESILGDTRSAVDTARKAEDVLKLQGNAVKNTTDSYKNINDSVEKLMVYLNYIAQNVGNIEEARVSTLGAIENISAVLEEIAASTNTVNQTSNDQLASVETLNKAAGVLNQNAEILVKEVNKFKVE